MDSLNINMLIDLAETITTDEQIGFAAEITMPVQDFIVEGTPYQLQLILTSVNIIKSPK
jgi:hypothetical protein